MWNFLNPFVNICPFCNQAQENNNICFECYSELIFLKNACIKCLEPFDFLVEGESVCNACAQKTFNYEQMQSALIYNNFTKRLLMRFKNGEDLFLRKIFAKLILLQCKIDENSAIVPIPLHKNKLIKRGFNHAYFLSKEIASLANCTCQELLIRVKNTQTQVNKTVKEQQENLQDAFLAIKRPNVQKIYVVDDVITTGATMFEAVKALKLQYPDVKIELISLLRRIKNYN